MATEDTDNVQRAEKVGLKRKLTGPPRLLLGKTRTRSEGEDRSEAKTDTVDEVDELSLKSATQSEITDLTETPDVDEEVLSAVKAESYRGRQKVTGDIRNRKVNRRRWWRRFSAVVVCTKRQKKNVEGSLEKQETVSVNHTEGNREGTFRRFQTSSDDRTREQSRAFVEKEGNKPLSDDAKPSRTLQKKLRRFFTRSGRSRSSAVPPETIEDEAPCSFGADVDKQTQPQSEKVLCPPHHQVCKPIRLFISETVTVTASEDQASAQSPKQLRGVINHREEDVTDAADGSGTNQMDSDGETADSAPFGRIVEVVSSDRDQILSTDVLNGDEERSSEVHNEKTPQQLQPSTNGPFILIQLVPPDDSSLQDEEKEDCWQGRSSENQNHLLRLLGFEHSEQQLLQTARSLVRAAVNAAVVQLSREQQGGSELIHGESLGCMDHARPLGPEKTSH